MADSDVNGRDNRGNAHRRRRVRQDTTQPDPAPPASIPPTEGLQSLGNIPANTHPNYVRFQNAIRYNPIIPMIPFPLHRERSTTEDLRTLRELIHASHVRVQSVVGVEAREGLLPHHSRMNQLLRSLYVRQYMRQEILRSYMTTNRQRSSRPSSPQTPTSETPPPPPHIPTHRFVPYPRLVPSLFRLSASEIGHAAPFNLVHTEEVVPRGLSPDEITRCTRTFQLDADTTDTCVICMAHLVANEFLRQLNCNHQFHKCCIDQWISANGVCPTCRRDPRLPQVTRVHDNVPGSSKDTAESNASDSQINTEEKRDSHDDKLW